MAYGDKLYMECHGYDLDGNPLGMAMTGHDDPLLAIQELMDGTEWSADTLEQIAQIMVQAGYRIRDMDDVDREDESDGPNIGARCCCNRCGSGLGNGLDVRMGDRRRNKSRRLRRRNRRRCGIGEHEKCQLS